MPGVIVASSRLPTAGERTATDTLRYGGAEPRRHTLTQQATAGASPDALPARWRTPEHVDRAGRPAHFFALRQEIGARRMHALRLKDSRVVHKGDRPGAAEPCRRLFADCRMK
jgi:hypothetical protein